MAESPGKDNVKAPKVPPPKPAQDDEIIVLSRSDLMARAFDLGIDRYDIMTNDELVAAIHHAERVLARSLQ